VIDFDFFLRQKYDIMRQEATDRGVGLRASANLDTVRAGLMPAESRANIGLTGAQAGLARANTANVNETTRYIGPLASASIGETRGRTRLLGAQSTGEELLNRGVGLYRIGQGGAGLGLGFLSN
jgi:hypothetical protein